MMTKTEKVVGVVTNVAHTITWPKTVPVIAKVASNAEKKVIYRENALKVTTNAAVVTNVGRKDTLLKNVHLKKAPGCSAEKGTTEERMKKKRRSVSNVEKRVTSLGSALRQPRKKIGSPLISLPSLPKKKKISLRRWRKESTLTNTIRYPSSVPDVVVAPRRESTASLKLLCMIPCLTTSIKLGMTNRRLSRNLP